jgi:hypothetical protein
LNGALENLLLANGANLLVENKHTFCEGNERGAVLVTSNEVSLVANAEVKVGKFHNPEGVNNCFERLNIWEQP